ncbi:MAG: hypothetical protein AB8B96_17325 [Lysobacterales bacterium]
MLSCLIVCLSSLSFSANVDSAVVARIAQAALDEQGTQGTFVLFDEQQQAYFRAEGTRSRQSLSPTSTYKILNALIALETAVVTGEQQIMRGMASNDVCRTGTGIKLLQPPFGGNGFFALHLDIQDNGAGRERVAIASEMLARLDQPVNP